MLLVSFSVSNYRSITKASRLPISQYTVLIGPNNEGKSNLLNALSAGMGLIEENARRPRQPGLLGRRLYSHLYDWEQDFPISLQESKPRGQSVFRLEFQLTDDEITEFRQHVKSNLNGTLPIELRIGPDHHPTFKVLKKGPGGPALTKKSAQIAQFIGSRVEFNYIPAIRTTDATEDVVARMVSRRLRNLEQNEEYRKAAEKLDKLQQPLLEELSNELRSTLGYFLPDVTNVKIETRKPRSPLGAYKTPCDIIIDDGTPTLLERKGDGIKSLAAISLLYRSEATQSATIIALEEPESHLHPRAIHRLREVLLGLSHKSQIVITSHNPLFVDRIDLRSNILVSENQATPAKRLSEIRELLGVMASDNLRHARLVLVVEGDTDRILLGAILAHRSKSLKKHLETNVLAIDHLGGATNLLYKLTELRASLCSAHTFLDNDDAGRSAVDKAIEADAVSEADCQFTTCKGMKNSELEDCINWKVYKDAIKAAFGVTLSANLMAPTNDKWSGKLEAIFKSQGRAWNKSVLARAKHQVVSSALKNLDAALVDAKAPSIIALADALEEKLSQMNSSHT